MSVDKSTVEEAIKEYLTSQEGVDERKRVFKEAFDEWIDRQFSLFGKWSMRGLILMLFSAVIFFWAKSKGLL